MDHTNVACDAGVTLDISTPYFGLDIKEKVDELGVKRIRAEILEYLVASISFEGIGDESFASPEAFCGAFLRLIQKDNGMYIKIGNTAAYIAEGFGIPSEKARPLIESCLSPEDAAKVRDYATTLNTPSPVNFELIFRHGYENAKCVHLFGDKL